MHADIVKEVEARVNYPFIKASNLIVLIKTNFYLGINIVVFFKKRGLFELLGAVRYIF